MSFHVGQKVVCVYGSWSAVWNVVENKPCAGTVYTVRGFGVEVFGSTLFLEEVVNPARFWADGKTREMSFWEGHFRPIVENKSSISFTIGADPESERWDNRVKVPAKADSHHH